MTSSRLLRATAAAGAVALAAAATALTAAPANGALTLRPRTYAAVLTPTSATPGVPTQFAVVVTNTSTVISALDHFVLAIPTGFVVDKGTVTSPRGGWTEYVAAGQLTASTSAPIRYGLRKGESMTVRFTATDGVACDARTVTWAQKADGVIVDPFVAQSADPQVKLTPVADNFQVTSVTDGSSPPLRNAVAVGAPFTVTGTFRCGSAPAKTGAASTLSLVKATPGTPDNHGVLQATTSTNVAAGSPTATLSGTTYSAIENQVGIKADWSAGAGDTFRLDVFGEVETVNATPGVAIPPAQLTVEGAQADLRNGANGPVSIVVRACGNDQTTAAPCSSGTEIELSGIFKNNLGAPLYNVNAPARISWLCPAVTCPHGGPNGPPEREPSTKYNYNFECPGSACVGEGSLFGEREVEEDFRDYPVFVSIRKNGVDTPFAAAPRCVPLPTSNYDPNRYARLHTTGQIVSPAAQTLGFCADVNAITRDGNAFTGGLRIPVLFVEDLKMRP